MPFNTGNLKVAKIAIVGCRDARSDVIRATLESLWVGKDFDYMDGCEILTGDAEGVDRVTREFAKDHKIPCRVFVADWARFGKSAGPVRNSQIVEQATEGMAFWDGKSRGTLDTISKMVIAGKPVHVISLKWVYDRYKEADE